MTDKNSIRLLWRQGDSVAEIARKTGVSRDTVYKYRDMDDFSPKPPARRAQGSKLDPYRPLIESWLDDDMRSGRKQRHTAKRVHDRLVSECGADVSVSTVERCVREIRARRSAEAADAQYLDLVWGPGEAQADFGEADFYVRGMRTTLSFFVMTFPYSNVGLAQVFPGETSECVCQALRNVFEHVGGVPTKIVFVSVNLFFTSFAKQARRLRKGGFTGCANVFSPIPVTARRGRPSAGPSACRTCRLS